MSLLKQFGSLVKWVTRSVLVILNNIYCIPTYVLWCVMLQPLLLLGPSYYWAIEGQLFYWLLTMVAYWSHSANYNIVETGDSIDGITGEETLVLVNHQSTSDVPLLMAAFSTRPQLLQHLNWIMDAVFKYTNFGIVSVLHGDFFIYAGREKREASILDLVTYLNDSYVPRKRKWIVLFPEGGFLRKRRETSNRYARKQGLPDLVNVTLPRMGAIQAIVDTIGPSSPSINHIHKNDKSDLKWVVDMTIAYPNGRPLDLFAVITGFVPPCDVHFHYRIFPIQHVPREKKELQGWLYARYLEKDQMLANYYSSGVWPQVVPTLQSDIVLTGDIIVSSASSIGEGSGCVQHPPSREGDGGEEEEEGEEDNRRERRVDQDLTRVLIIHAFFILSTLVHIHMLRAIYSTLSTRIANVF